ncbi:MAG: hypothetical protein HXY47_05250, partial [Nitrospirae bacterium]|nr:hypothetical protein [Nitrospirota bacterium]
MMVAHSLEEPPLVKGGLWGIGRLGKRITDALYFFKEKVIHPLQSEESEILGLATWAMGETSFKPALKFLKSLMNRKENVCIYIEGNFIEKTLEEWAKESIDKIEL